MVETLVMPKPMSAAPPVSQMEGVKVMQMNWEINISWGMEQDLSDIGEKAIIGSGPQVNSVSSENEWRGASGVGDESGESIGGSEPSMKLSSALCSLTNMASSSSSTVVSELGHELPPGEG